MNARRFTLALVVAAISLSAAQEASAYYAAHMGRFTSRDPNGEVGRFGMEMPPDSGMAMGFVDREQFDPMAAYDDGMNLYQYTGGNPLIHTDPSGLFFGWGYGKYCGWSKRGPGKPTDALDAACQRHDQCQATWWTCNPYHLSKCSIGLCNDAIDARDSGCKQSWPNDPQKQKDCKNAARDVILLFCSFTLNTGGIEYTPGMGPPALH